MNITGKGGRVVPVILTPEVADCMKILTDVQTRKKAGISDENKFAFPLSHGSTNHIRGCDAFSEILKEADLEQPENFKSTNLRKYVATVSQVLNMKDMELDWLAHHLGHDIRVHREYYRLQEQHVELAKVSKLLYAIDSGQAHKYAGKGLNEISVDDLDDVEDKDEESSDEESEDKQDDDVEGSSLLDEGPPAVEDLGKMLTETTGKGKKPVKKTSVKKTSYGREIVSKGNGKKCTHTPWSPDEKAFMIKEFHSAVISKKIAGIGKKQFEDAKQKASPLLESRTWVQMKSWLKNYIQKQEKEAYKLNLRAHTRN